MPDRFGKISIHATEPAVSPDLENDQPSPPPSLKKPKKKRDTSLRKINGKYIWGLALIVLFGCYNALGFLGIPYYLTSTLPSNFNKKTGLVLDPGRISFNPFTYRFTVENAKIASEAGSALASLHSLTAELAPFSLLRLNLVCNAVTLTDISINLTREQDGTYNFEKMIGQKQGAGPSEILNFSDFPFFFSLNNIAIRNGNIVFVDSPTGKSHSIEKIQLDLPSFSNIPFQTNQYLRPSFSAVINGSPVELTGKAHVGDSAGEITSLECNLHALDIPVYTEYIPFDLPLQFTGGKADGTINLLFDPTSQQDDKLSMDFELQLTDTELQTEDQMIRVTAPATQLKGKVKPIAKTVVFTNISSSKPVVQSIGSTFLSSINVLFKKEKKTSTNNNPVDGTPFSLTIEELVFKDGTYHYFKEKGAKKAESSWNGLQLGLNNFSSSASAEKKNESGSFLLSGFKEGTSSSFTWQGDLTSTDNLHGTLTLAAMDFKDLLTAIGTAKPFEVKGSSELQGKLTLSFPQEANVNISYKLTDAELIVQDFQLVDEKLTILSGPTLKISSLGNAYKTIHFGSVSLQNGTALLPVKRVPEIFKEFTTGKYLIDNLDFTGQISLLSDDKGKQKTNYTGIELKARDLDTPEKAKDNFSLTAKASGGGVIQGKGDVRLKPFSLTFDTEFDNLNAIEIFPVITQSVWLNSLVGTLSGKGSLTLPKKSFSGDLQLAKASYPGVQKAIFSWNDMMLQGVNYTAEPFHMAIATATIKQPQFSWHINDNDGGPLQQLGLFFQHYLVADESEKASKENVKPQIFPLDIGAIHIDQGNIHIQDNRLKPKWKGEVSDFSGDIKNIRLPSEDSGGELAFTGKLQNCPLTVKGQANFFSKEGDGKLQMTLDDFPVVAFSEYLAAKTDVNTKIGTFDLQLNSITANGNVQNSGSVVFSGVKPLSEKSDSALTLALLTGTDDKFQVDFDFTRTPPHGKSILLQEILSVFQTKGGKGRRIATASGLGRFCRSYRL